jgi:hypothetical protein
MALSVEVPLGGTQIYADGVKVGAVDEGVATDGPAPPQRRMWSRT